MTRALKKLKKKPKFVLVDGNRSPKIKNLKFKAIIKGDEKILTHPFWGIDLYRKSFIFIWANRL